MCFERVRYFIFVVSDIVGGRFQDQCRRIGGRSGEEGLGRTDVSGSVVRRRSLWLRLRGVRGCIGGEVCVVNVVLDDSG